MASDLASANTTQQWRPAAAILREWLADPSKIVVCPGVYDGYTARIALRQGFDCLYMTGAGTSATRLGSPDMSLITLTEMHANASMIASLDPKVPLIADADHGFGGPLSVARTVTAYINSNVAGLHIEDQAITKRCGHLLNKELVPLETWLVRVRAAVAARKQSGRDIVIIVRTDAFQSEGWEGAITRLKGAVAEGADVAFFEGFLTKEQGRKVCEAMAPTPCLINLVDGGVTPFVTAAEAKDMGFKILIHSVMSLTAVYKAVGKEMKELKETGFVKPKEDGIGGIRDVFGILGMEECAQFDRVVGSSSFTEGW